MKSAIRVISNTVTLVFIMGLGLVAGVANANVVQLDGWNSSSGSQTATFGDTVSSSFNDVLTFALPGGSSGKDLSNLITLSLGSGISLSSVQLWDGNNLIGSGSKDGSSSSSLSFISGSTPQNYTLKIFGYGDFGSGSYCGKIIVNPVPEPQTYAMLLIGLVLVGFSARRRKDNTDD
ncbi:MAG: FxDxF family PEP-CTERM protein [Gallionella sp.]